MEIYENLKKIRERNHLTQEDMALRLGMSQQMISKIESGRGTTVKTLCMYAKALEYDIIPTPSVSDYFKDSYLYQKYLSLNSLSENSDVIISHVAALELLGFFSGYFNEYEVEFYSTSQIIQYNAICHKIDNPFELGFVQTKGVRCTDINRTLNDVLLNADRIDDTPILEALNTYYYKNGESFDNLLLTEEAREVLKEYEEDAINYC